MTVRTETLTTWRSFGIPACEHGRRARYCHICAQEWADVAQLARMEYLKRIAELEAEVAEFERRWHESEARYTELAEHDNSVMDAALRERTEECAKVCDERFDSYTKGGGKSSGVFAMEAWNCAAAIRDLLAK